MHWTLKVHRCRGPPRWTVNRSLNTPRTRAAWPWSIFAPRDRTPPPQDFSLPPLKMFRNSIEKNAGLPLIATMHYSCGELTAILGLLCFYRHGVPPLHQWFTIFAFLTNTFEWSRRGQCVSRTYNCRWTHRNIRYFPTALVDAHRSGSRSFRTRYPVANGLWSHTAR